MSEDEFEPWIRRLDLWVAGAFHIAPEDRHDLHEHALDRCAGLVIWLDQYRAPLPLALPVIRKVMPLMATLDGTSKQRTMERKQLIAAL